MRPPLRKRLGLADRAVAARTDRGTMARALMYAFAGGGAISLLALAGAAPSHLARIGVTAAVAWGAALLLLSLYADTPRWAFPLLVAAGTGAVLWTVWAGGRNAVPYAVLLALPIAYSAHFFTKLEAFGQVTLAAGGYVP